MAHEDLTREQPVEGSSDRSFSLVLAGAFLVISVRPLLPYGHMPRWWASGVAVVLALVARLKPATLGGLNRLWTRFGVLLSRVVSPITLGILFYGVVTPIGVVMRLRAQDGLSGLREHQLQRAWRAHRFARRKTHFAASLARTWTAWRSVLVPAQGGSGSRAQAQLRVGFRA